MSNKHVLVIMAHSRDCNSVTYRTDGKEYDLEQLSHGYVPRGLDIGGGDDIHLEIDIETGTIIGWDTAAVKAKLADYVEQLAESGDD